MIGNAIPPMFAEALARAGAATALGPQDSSTKGTLVRFDATQAEGMSPALAQVVDMVERRYLSGARQATTVSLQEQLFDT
jgi:hypothetical protein